MRFTEELRNLFALMIGSYRKYVDPSKAVEILKEGFRSHTGVSDSQQVLYFLKFLPFLNSCCFSSLTF